MELPFRAQGGLAMFRAREKVFSYLLLCVCVLWWETKLESEEETKGQLWCNNLALTLDIFLLLGGEDFREILSTLAVRRCG